MNNKLVGELFRLGLHEVKSEVTTGAKAAYLSGVLYVLKGQRKVLKLALIVIVLSLIVVTAVFNIVNFIYFSEIMTPWYQSAFVLFNLSLLILSLVGVYGFMKEKYWLRYLGIGRQIEELLTDRSHPSAHPSKATVEAVLTPAEIDRLAIRLESAMSKRLDEKLDAEIERRLNKTFPIEA